MPHATKMPTLEDNANYYQDADHYATRTKCNATQRARGQKLSALINMHYSPKALSAMFHDSLQDEEKDWRKMPWPSLQAHYIMTAKKIKKNPNEAGQPE